MNLFDSIIKYTGLFLCSAFIFAKTINKSKTSFLNKSIIFIFTVVLSSLQYVLQSFSPIQFRIILICFIQSILYSKIFKIKIGYSIIIYIFSISLTYVFYNISTIITLIIEKYLLISFISPNSTILLGISLLLLYVLVYLIFRTKRFRNGFPFIKQMSDNIYLEIPFLVFSAIVILLNFIISNIHDMHSTITIAIGFVMISILLFILVQRSFIFYQKQKLQTKALKDYEQELAETKEKLSIAITEKEKLVKSNHEFYHRQEAINKKLDDLMVKQKLLGNTEFGEDIGNLQDRINTLSNEYVQKTKTLPKLVKTNIVEIDDMFSYLQSECDKNNIEFILKIECDINYIIENFISKNQLETLLGDMVRNAIIAVNHSSNSFRSIMVVLGIKDNDYEICIFDSGIPFKIETLINLGLRPASTHLDEGGTGIGFITTFETINSCNASFIINENTNSNYTKSLEIKFDNKNEYVIISNRSKEIKESNSLDRNIIILNG